MGTRSPAGRFTLTAAGGVGKGGATPPLLFHMDTYRLESTPEAEELDLDSMLAQGALLIEWPERMNGLIPTERLWVNLEHIDEEEREMKFKATGRRYDELLEVIRHGTFGGN